MIHPRVLAAAVVLAVPVAATKSWTVDQTRLQRLESAVARLRQLKVERPVRVVFLDDVRFNRTYAVSAHRSTPDHEVALNQREYRLLGLLGPRDNLQHILFGNLASQVGGFYDDRTKVLYVRNHSNQVLGLRRDLIAHEFTHALQDQHYNLQRLVPDPSGTYRNTDAAFAHKALVEGDAVNTQYLYISGNYSQAEVSALLKQQSKDSKPPPIPRAIQRTFDFQYTAGLAFAQRLFQRGGGMPGVDAAYRRLPSSTYEVMHPGAYFRHWRPTSISMRGLRGFSTWIRVDDDVLGAFGYDLLLWQYLPHRSADQVVQAYRGDRYILLHRHHADVMVLRSTWSDGAGAKRAEDALTLSLHKRFGRAMRPAGNAFVYPGGAAVLTLAGKTVSLAYGPDVRTVERAASAPAS